MSTANTNDHFGPIYLLTTLKNYFCFPETKVPIAYAVLPITTHIIIYTYKNIILLHQLYSVIHLFLNN